MRLVFLGSGEFGLPTLDALLEHHDVALVVSQPDRPAGRGKKLTPTAIAAAAQIRGIELIRTDNANAPEVIERIEAIAPDAGVVIAFGQKLSPELIGVLGKLAVNLHSSLLPAYRGAAPIVRAMLDDVPETGVSVIGLAQRMDAGAVYVQKTLPIGPKQTAGELHDALAALGPDAVGEVLEQLANETLQPLEQDHTQATPARKLSKADGTVDLNLPASVVRARINGLTPWPGCRVLWTDAQGAVETLILRRAIVIEEGAVDCPPLPEVSAMQPGDVLDHGCVVTGQGIVKLLEVQPPGARSMLMSAFTAGRGQGFGPGHRLAMWEPPA